MRLSLMKFGGSPQTKPMNMGIFSPIICLEHGGTMSNDKSSIQRSWLVVEPYPSEKYEFVSWDDYSQYMGK